MLTKDTHILGGITLALLLERICLPHIDILSFKGTMDILVFYTSAISGSLIPDIDKTNSYIGKRLPYISKMVSKTFKHRTLTHSIIFVFSMYYILYYLSINKSITFGITVGILSHILLDMLNFQGVSLLYPIRTKYTICKIRTSSSSESTLSGILVVAVIGIISFRLN